MTVSALYPNLRPSLLLDFANSRQLDPRITFTRSTTATYYDGITTAKAEENLLINSTGNGTSSVSVTLTTSATTAPDGTSTAVKLTPTATNDRHIIYQYNATGTYGSGLPITASVFVKAGGYNYAQLGHFQDSSGANGGIIVDLTNGSITTVAGNLASYSATSVGNGWYRLAITFVATFSSGTGLIVAASNSGTPATTAGSPLFTGDGTSAIYFWGMQMEQRSSATAYTATTTQAITNYIPVLQTASAGQARFDHTPTTGESLGLLIEEQRTNSLTYSAQFDNAAWTKVNATITANTIVAPDGTLTGDKFVEGSGASQVPQVYVNTSISASTVFTLSIYAKAAERNWFIVNANDGFGSHRTWFNLSTGVVGTNAAGTTATITPVGNGWYRCTASRSTQSTVPNTPTQAFQVADADGSQTYTGNGFSGIFIWGAQLEISGSFATSYIPTVASTVTRNADAASMTGTNFSSWFNNAQGTLYAEQYITNVTAGSVNNQTAACLYKDSGNFIATGQGVGNAGGTGQQSSVWVQTNNITQVFAGTGNFITVGLTLKNAVAYETNNFAYSANTQTLITDTSGTVPAVNSLSIGFYLIGINYYANNPIRKIAFYPVRVTNAQLQALTS